MSAANTIPLRPSQQYAFLEQSGEIGFEEKLLESGLPAIRTNALEIFQMNLGKMCNQSCKHCHVDAGPTRTEIMTRETMQLCLDCIREGKVQKVDLTGGAPEMNPDFEWLIGELHSLGVKIMVRCNLTILVSGKKFEHLVDRYAEMGVEVISSLPFYNASRTDRQRGNGVFNKSIEALKRLNERGYGKEGSGLELNLVYNPAGAFLPGDQTTLERDFQERLEKDFGVYFNHLFTITNMPISRYLDYLLESGNYEQYMQKLISAFNPAAAQNVMCKNTLSVGWDGFLYDCDFNQMLDLKIHSSAQHICDFSVGEYAGRKIITGKHCFGCTAGSGSSCGGAVV